MVVVADKKEAWKTEEGNYLVSYCCGCGWGELTLLFYGISKIKVTKVNVCKKMGVVRYILMIGAAAIWETNYNNARAEGDSPLVAGTKATLLHYEPGGYAFTDWVYNTMEENTKYLIGE